jgi:RNA polymerase subunit RPABC4/transcription elongation factor Spt4
MLTSNNGNCPHCKGSDIYYRTDAIIWECLLCSKWFDLKILTVTENSMTWAKWQYSRNKISNKLEFSDFLKRIFVEESWMCANGHESNKPGLCTHEMPNGSLCCMFPKMVNHHSLHYCKNCGNIFYITDKDRCPFCLSTHIPPYTE